MSFEPIGFSESRMEKARALRAGGASWGRIVAETGISIYLLKCEMVPGYREKEQQKTVERRTGMRMGMPTRPKRMVVSYQLETIKHRVQECQIIPFSVIEERERAVTQPLSIGQLLLGDPLPGRSALDKKRKSEMQRVFG